ncbi:MAG: DUF4126 domain-containing protein [Chloroflexi bacterium]|nr:DUF4126 domain-containing protein [Chloroflexota bacterium]MCL5273694.1 DUF4126 domain-containing protein [Chloroflexota bacterium]
MALANIVSAFGLAGAAGLNAYIPLLIVAVLGRAQVIHLTEPFDVLTSWWVIGALVILLIVEVVIDKAPGADHINDAIQTFVRPTAGAILFAANAGIVRDASPALALVVGLLLAFGVHAAKATARPVVNATTFGLGAPAISVVEDATSAIASLLAVYAPALLVVFVALVIFAGYKVYSRIKRNRAAGVVQ